MVHHWLCVTSNTLSHHCKTKHCYYSFFSKIYVTKNWSVHGDADNTRHIRTYLSNFWRKVLMYEMEHRENFQRFGVLGLLKSNLVDMMLRLVARQKFPSMSSLEPRLRGEKGFKINIRAKCKYLVLSVCWILCTFYPAPERRISLSVHRRNLPPPTSPGPCRQNPDRIVLSSRQL